MIISQDVNDVEIATCRTFFTAPAFIKIRSISAIIRGFIVRFT